MVDNAEAVESSSQDTKKSLNILVVDDNVFNLDIIVEYMEDEGHNTVCCEHAVAAWKFMEEKGDEVDLILLDRMMPHMDGMTFFDKLKRSDFKDVPVVMISAMADANSVQEGKDAGIFGYITKPFERESLLQVIEEASKTIPDKN